MKIETMVIGAGESPVSDDEAALGLGWSAVLQRRPLGAVLRLQHPEQGSVSVEIAMTAAGPVIRASAAALEIDAATDIVARCESFAIEARESFTVRAGEIDQEASGALRVSGETVAVDARQGDVSVRANDDVRLLGEQILLNCEDQEALPSWLPGLERPADATVHREDVSGDVTVFEDEPAK